MSGEAAISEVLSRDLSDIHNADTTKLAYIGDAVYEVYVRLKSAEACGRHAGEMNKFTVHYVRADSQAKAARGMVRDIADNKEDVEIGLTMEELPQDLVLKTPSDGLCGISDEEKLGVSYEAIHNYIRHPIDVNDPVNQKIAKLEAASRHKRAMPLILEPFI